MACKLLFLTFVEPAISNQMMRENSHCVKKDVVENKTASHSNFSRFLLQISASTTPHSPVIMPPVGHHLRPRAIGLYKELHRLGVRKG